MSTYGDLSPEETRALEEDHVVLPSPAHGKRKVSAALLAPPPNQDSNYSSSSYSGSTSSSSATSVRFRSFNSSRAHTIDLPESIYSVAALEFIGFTTETASEILARFNSRPDPAQCPDDLIDYVIAYPLWLTSAPFQHYSLTEGMTALGLNQQLQDALTDPRFSTIFWTETAVYWIKDTLRINYLTLIQLQSRLSNHATRSLLKKPRRGSLEAVFQPAAAAAPPLQTEPPTATLTMTSEDHNLPKTYVTVQTAGPVLQDHYVLYKATAATEMGEWIQDDGNLDMQAIASLGGCDFNHKPFAWYWTLEAETAEIYRAWASRRCFWSDTWIIRIQIPTIFIDSLRQQSLWDSRDWKEYVWYCKKRSVPPPKYDSYWKAGGADLVKGHICTGVSSSVTRIKKEELQAKMTEENLVMISSGKASQWAFMNEATAERLAMEIRGKIHIDITAATNNSDPAAG